MSMWVVELQRVIVLNETVIIGLSCEGVEDTGTDRDYDRSVTVTVTVTLR